MKSSLDPGSLDFIKGLESGDLILTNVQLNAWDRDQMWDRARAQRIVGPHAGSLLTSPIVDARAPSSFNRVILEKDQAVVFLGVLITGATSVSDLSEILHVMLYADCPCFLTISAKNFNRAFRRISSFESAEH